MTPKEVRALVIEKLTAANIAGGRIYDADVNPLKLTGRTMVAVFIPNRSYNCVDPFNDISYTAFYTLEIDCIVPIEDNYADTLDDLVEDVKTALFSDSEFYSNFADMPTISETVDITNEGEYRLATCNLQIELQVCLKTY